MKQTRERSFQILVCLVLALTICSSVLVNQAHGSVTTTVTLLSPTTDGYIYNSDGYYGSAGVYLTARNSLTGTVDSSSISAVGGQFAFIDPNLIQYVVYRQFPFFDTSSIPAGATIDSWNLSLYVVADYSTTDFEVTIQQGVGVYPHSPLQTGDYYYGFYSGNGGNRSTDEIDGVGFWNITGTQMSWINAGGITKFCVRSSNDIDAVEPTGDEYVEFATRESGEAYAEKLYVTYTVGGTATPTPTLPPSATPSPTPSPTLPGTTPTPPPAGPTNYIFHGPYYESGAVANVDLNVTMYQPHAAPVSFFLNGTDTIADTATYALAQPATNLAWNVTSTGNYRIYAFDGSTFDEVWVYLTDPDVTSDTFQFSIVDFYGMTNPQLSTIINVGGQQRIVERKSLTAALTTFVMETFHTYTFKYTCAQGSYSHIFDVPGVSNYPTGNPITEMILVGDFPTTNPGTVTATATRTNATTIDITYGDGDGATVWLYVEITHYEDGTKVTDYSTNTTGNVFSYSWTSAESTTDYVVNVQAYRFGAIYPWMLSCPIVTGSNPFTGALDFLGTWPGGVDPAQVIVAIIIILSGIGVFSYWGQLAGCGFSWLMFGIFLALGWYQASIANFIFAGLITVLIGIEEGKKVIREV
jgi:hypothetical protein